jgi:hypothetical protein
MWPPVLLRARARVSDDLRQTRQEHERRSRTPLATNGAVRGYARRRARRCPNRRRPAVVTRGQASSRRAIALARAGSRRAIAIASKRQPLDGSLTSATFSMTAIGLVLLPCRNLPAPVRHARCGDAAKERATGCHWISVSAPARAAPVRAHIPTARFPALETNRGRGHGQSRTARRAAVRRSSTFGCRA